MSSSNGTTASTPSTHNQSSSSDVQYERMSPYSYNNMYYNDGSNITSPGPTPSPSPPDSRHNKKQQAYKMEEIPTPQMSPMEMNENIHSSSKTDYEQSLPASSANYNNSKNRYSYDASAYDAGTKNDYHYGNNERLYEDQHQAANHHVEKKSNYGGMPPAAPSTTIAAMGNGMYVMCSNRGVLDQGHVVTGTYFPPLPTSQDHQNLGTGNILSTSSHHHHHHYMNTQTTSSLTSSLASNQIMSSSSNDVKYRVNDSNNNKHGSENNNKTNKINEMNNSKSESKGFQTYKDKTTSKCDDMDDKLIKNDSNNNSNQDNKNNNKISDMTQNVNNNRLVLSSPTSALSPYHHQSYLSQYKNHINYSDQAIQQQQHQDEISDPQSNMNKYNNFAEYDPYQSNTIYYHPSSHFAHSHPSLNALPPTTAAPTAFYVTNPDYYHQSYAMTSSVPAGTALVQPMVAKIDAVIGTTSIPLHPAQTLMNDSYVTTEQLKEDDFSNILAGVRKTCYSN